MIGNIIFIGILLLIVLFVFPRIEGIKVSENWVDALIVVIIFVCLNYAFRLLLVMVTLGFAWILYYITLGIAGLVLNALILMLISKLFPEKLKVSGFWPSLFGAFFISLATFALGR